MKKIIAVNAGPRKGWNTDLLIKEAVKGAEENGAEVELIYMNELEKYSGCVSCFGCKIPGKEGKCICKDGLTPVLDKIREADGLIIGSPNYLGNMTAEFRAIYERLIFQYITYRHEDPSCNDRHIPVLLIMTTNCPEEVYGVVGYDKLLEDYKNTFDSQIGPTEVLYSGETLQVNDYSKYNWTIMDVEKRKKLREEKFPVDLSKAYEIGKKMAQ